MTSVPPPSASRIATRRIGIANGLLWIVAGIVLVVVGATTAYTFVVAPYTGGDIFANPNGYPWEAETPVVAEEVEPNEWQADGSAVIRLDAEDFQDPHVASIVAGADLDLYRTNPADLEIFPGERPWPDYFGYLYGDRELVIVPSGHDFELWIRAAGPWQLRLAPLDVVEVTDVYAGKGDAFVIYRGDAVSARLTHVGAGVFFVDVYTAFENDTGAIIETNDVDRRISWDPDSWVVFGIESDAERGAWTIDIEQIARPTPSPTPTEDQ